MDPDWVTGSGLRQVCERFSGRKGRSAYYQRKADPLIFGTKMALCLWRADLSFRNSVTGSGSKAKCSNILEDKSDKHSSLFHPKKFKRSACWRNDLTNTQLEFQSCRSGRHVILPTGITSTGILSTDVSSTVISTCHFFYRDFFPTIIF